LYEELSEKSEQISNLEDINFDLVAQLGAARSNSKYYKDQLKKLRLYRSQEKILLRLLEKAKGNENV